MNKREEKKGFTLLELLIVIGLIVIFSVMMLPYGVDFYHSRVLDEETRSVSNVLQRAQSHAISGRDDADWGVEFFNDQGRYEIFRGSECGVGDVYQTFQLPEGMEMEGVECIIFERHTGNPQITTE